MSVTKAYMDWVMGQQDDCYTLTRKDEDHIRLDAENVYGEVNIHHIELEVVELRLSRKRDDEGIFFLHFELKDPEYAKSLFQEMIGVLKKEADHKALRILLTCTSAMTTSFFAGKLSEGAKTLSLDYEIAATPYPILYEKAFDYDVIMLAPQIAYEYEKVKEILHDKLVLNVPPALFATYDTGGVLDFIREQLKFFKKEEKKTAIAKVMRDIDNNSRIFVITVTHDLNKTMYRYRLYNRGEVEYEGEVRKALNKIEDIYDILDVQLFRCGTERKPDMVAISMPGVMVRPGEDGLDLRRDFARRINYRDFAEELSGKYRLPFYIINNTDAVALGFYAGQDKYDCITYHSQPRGSLVGGEGMVMHGQVITGGHYMGGEINGIFRMLLTDRKDDEETHLFRPPGKIREALTYYLVANICIFDPEVILVRSDLTPEMELLEERISAYIEPERMPKLIHVKDISEYAYLGTMSFGLHEHKKAVAREL